MSGRLTTGLTAPQHATLSKQVAANVTDHRPWMNAETAQKEVQHVGPADR
jgi:hypothetical protein